LAIPLVVAIISSVKLWAPPGILSNFDVPKKEKIRSKRITNQITIKT